jgi:hypothetical protein
MYAAMLTLDSSGNSSVIQVDIGWLGGSCGGAAIDSLLSGRAGGWTLGGLCHAIRLMGDSPVRLVGDGRSGAGQGRDCCGCGGRAAGTGHMLCPTATSCP